MSNAATQAPSNKIVQRAQQAGQGGTALAIEKNDDVAAAHALLNRSAKAFEKILPKHVTPERFLRVAMTAVTKDPKLAKCDPRSLIMAMIHAAELGLEPNTPQQHAFIIPYGNEAQFQIGWRGLLELVDRSGQLADLVVELVRENDEFGIEMGDEPKILHRIPIDKDRGPIVGAYMSARLTNGGRRREWMSRKELDAIRQRFAANGSTAWNQEETYGEMCRKTVFKRGAKKLPKANEYLRRAQELEDAYEARAEGKPAQFSIPSEVLAALPPEVAGPNTATERLKSQMGVTDGMVDMPALEGTTDVPPMVEPSKETAAAKPANKSHAKAAASRAVEKGEVKPPVAAKKQGWEDLDVGDQWKSPESGKVYVVVATAFGKAIQELEEPPVEDGADGAREGFE